MNNNKAISPQHIEFWLEEAHALKKAADSYWEADVGFKHQLEIGKLHGVAQVLIQDGIDTETEMNWLYNNLAAFAVYYLAIGILIARNPSRFLHEAPQQRLVELIEECGISLSVLQRRFLLRVENAFAYHDQKTNWTLSLKSEELRMLKREYAAHEAVTAEQKEAMDGLFSSLCALAGEVSTKESQR